MLFVPVDVEDPWINPNIKVEYKKGGCGRLTSVSADSGKVVFCNYSKATANENLKACMLAISNIRNLKKIQIYEGDWGDMEETFRKELKDFPIEVLSSKPLETEGKQPEITEEKNDVQPKTTEIVSDQPESIGKMELISRVNKSVESLLAIYNSLVSVLTSLNNLSDKQEIKEVQVEVIKEVQVEVIKEVQVEVIKEVQVEVIKEVQVEVPVEVIKEVPVEVIKEVPVEVIKEVIKEVPVEVIKEVPVEVIKEEKASEEKISAFSKRINDFMGEHEDAKCIIVEDVDKFLDHLKELGFSVEGQYFDQWEDFGVLVFVNPSEEETTDLAASFMPMYNTGATSTKYMNVVLNPFSDIEDSHEWDMFEL